MNEYGVYIARQVKPEYQMSPFDEGDIIGGNDIAIMGNDDLREVIPPIVRKVYDVLESGDIDYEAKLIERKNSFANYESIRDAVEDLLPSDRWYSDEEIETIVRTARHWREWSDWEENLCTVLTIVTGKEWDWAEIHGCVQGEWQYIIFRKDEWDIGAREWLEIEYFNLGTEWIVDDGGENLYHYSKFCPIYDYDNIRKEIAEQLGVDVEEVVLKTA